MRDNPNDHCGSDWCGPTHGSPDCCNCNCPACREADKELMKRAEARFKLPKSDEEALRSVIDDWRTLHPAVASVSEAVRRGAKLERMLPALLQILLEENTRLTKEVTMFLRHNPTLSFLYGGRDDTEE